MTRPQRLFNKNFVLLWQGQFVSQLGNQAHIIAMMFWLKHATESAGMMGLIMMLSMLPSVILGPLGGTFADRFSRKWIIVLCDAFSGIAVVSLAIMMFSKPHAVDLLVVWLGAVAVILGILSAVFRPAISASIPDLVPEEKVAAANSFNQSSFQVSALVGQGTGGVLFRILGAPVLFLIDGITYIISAISELFIGIPQEIPEKTRGARETMRVFLRDTGEGFTYIWRNKGMRDLFFAATVLNFFMSPFAVLLPFYIEDYLYASPDWFGYFLAAIGLGAMIGFALAGVFRFSGRTRMVMVIGFLFIDALLIASLGLTRATVTALLLGFLIGLLNSVVNINIVTILQVTTPGRIRGRVFGVLGTISGGLVPIGMGLAGVVAGLVNNNIPPILIVSGCMVALCTLLVSFRRNFREFLSYEPPAPAEAETSATE